MMVCRRQRWMSMCAEASIAPALAGRSVPDANPM
jgi:hypothetical protein